MRKLVCEICGGSLTINVDNIAECENCGIKYSKEKVSQMVKIDGAVEITYGESEKERLFKNVETFLSLGKHEKAYELCQQITNEYPNDYRSWYLAFKSGVYGLAKDSFELSRNENNLTVVDSHLANAIKLSKNKDELGREAIRFWLCVLSEEDTALYKLYQLHYLNKCGEKHVVSVFLRKVDAQISSLLKQLNSSQNKKVLCENLGFYLNIGESLEVKRIDSFSHHLGCIVADGVVIRKVFDGLSFWGQKTKYRYEETAQKNIYRLCISSYNKLHELINRTQEDGSSV